MTGRSRADAEQEAEELMSRIGDGLQQGLTGELSVAGESEEITSQVKHKLAGRLEMEQGLSPRFRDQTREHQISTRK